MADKRIEMLFEHIVERRRRVRLDGGEIIAGAEGAAGAGDDRDANALVPFGPDEGVEQFVGGLVSIGVELGGPLDRDPDNRAAAAGRGGLRGAHEPPRATPFPPRATGIPRY